MMDLDEYATPLLSSIQYRVFKHISGRLVTCRVSNVQVWPTHMTTAGTMVVVILL